MLDDAHLIYDEDYISNLSEEIVETTLRHIDEDEDEEEDIEDELEDYYLSAKRAIIIAQNEANTVMNRVDFFNAQDNGKKYKVWVAELDDRTRPWHMIANGTKVPINEKFSVGGELMLYPHDPSASAENTVNCRCACKYE